MACRYAFGCEKRRCQGQVRKLTEAERDADYETATLDKYADKTPEQIVAITSQEGSYLASPSTFYRIVRNRKAVHRRQESKTPIRRYQPPQRVATGPNRFGPGTSPGYQPK